MKAEKSQNTNTCCHTYIMQTQSKCLVSRVQAVTEGRHTSKCCPQLIVKNWETRVNYQELMNFRNHDHQVQKVLLI